MDNFLTGPEDDDKMRGEPWEYWFAREVMSKFEVQEDAMDFYRRCIEQDLTTCWSWPEVVVDTPVFLGMN